MYASEYLVLLLFLTAQLLFKLVSWKIRDDGMKKTMRTVSL